MFLVEHRFEPGTVLNHTFIVTTDLGGSVNRCTEHPQFASECLEVLVVLVPGHCNEMTGALKPHLRKFWRLENNVSGALLANVMSLATLFAA